MFHQISRSIVILITERVRSYHLRWTMDEERLNGLAIIIINIHRGEGMNLHKVLHIFVQNVHLYICNLSYHYIRILFLYISAWFKTFTTNNCRLSITKQPSINSDRTHKLWNIVSNEIYTPYEDAAGMLLHINRKFTMGKWRSFLVEEHCSYPLLSQFICIGQGMQHTMMYLSINYPLFNVIDAIDIDTKRRII